MTRRLLKLLPFTAIIGLLWLTVTLPGSGQNPPAPAKPKSPRLDAYGDPLPEGAVARLGSSRLRIDGPTMTLTFGPKDTTLMAHCPGHVIVWDRKSGKELRRFKVPSSWASTFSPDGKLLAVADRDVRILDTATGKELQKLSVPGLSYEYYRSPLAFSKNGKTLAVVAGNKVVLYDWANSKQLRSFEGMKRIITLALSPNKRWLAVAAGERAVHLWDVASGKQVHTIKTSKYFLSSGTVCFSPDGKYVVVGNMEERMAAEVATGKKIASFTSSFYCPSVIFTGDSCRLISGHLLQGLHIWNLETNKTKRFFKAKRFRRAVFALSHDGTTLAAGDKDAYSRNVRLWNLKTGKEVFSEPGHERYIVQTAYALDGKTVITGSQGEMIFWDALTGKKLRQIGIFVYNTTAFSPDRKVLANPRGRSVTVEELTDGKEVGKLEYKGKDVIRFAAFSPDGKQLVTAHNKCRSDNSPRLELGKNGLHVWDAATGKELRTFTAERDCFYTGLTLTPDGNIAVLGTAGGYVTFSGSLTRMISSKGGPLHVWDLRIGTELLILKGHQKASYAVAISPDGHWLASLSFDKTFRLWELASGKTIFTFKAGKSRPQAVAFSPNGRLLATVSTPEGDAPDEIRIRDLATGKQIHRFRGYKANVTLLNFSPDGSRLASTLDNGTVLLWDMTPLNRASRRQLKKIKPAELPKLWAELGSLDALKAHHAIWRLIDAPEQAVALLEKKIQPISANSPRIKKLIADLDSNRFAVREAAKRELEKLADLAEPAMRRTLKNNPPLEVWLRIQPLVKYEKVFVNPPALRRLRSVQILEHIGTKAARRVLHNLAKGDPDARLTRDAANALKRLERGRGRVQN